MVVSITADINTFYEKYSVDIDYLKIKSTCRRVICTNINISLHLQRAGIIQHCQKRQM